MAPRAYRTHLWLAEVGREGSARALTQGRQSATSPAWAPDGSALAFVRSVEGTPQVFWLPLDGGEAVQLTRLPHGATDPQVSPTGERVLVQSRLPFSAVDSLTRAAPPFDQERPGRRAADADAAPDAAGSAAAIRAFLAQNAEDGTAEVTTRLRFQGEQSLAPALHFSHLYTVPASAAGAPHAAESVTSGWASYANAQWMPDGQNVVADGYAGATHPDRNLERHLFSVRLGNRPRPMLQLDGYRTSRPQLSPDGGTVAFLAQRLDDPGYAQTELGLLALDGTNTVTWLTGGFDRSVSEARFGPDGWYLYFVAPSDGGFPLFRVPTGAAPPAGLSTDGVAERLQIASEAGLADSLLAALDPADRDRRAALADSLAERAATGPVRLTAPDAGIRAFDVGRSGIAYVVTTPENPYELALAAADGRRPRLLTRHNAGWLEGRRVQPMTKRTLTRLLPIAPDTLRLDTLAARALLADTLRLDSLGRHFSDLPRAIRSALAADTTGRLLLAEDRPGADTLAVDYWVIEPAGRQRGRRYPLLVQMHGGPSAMWGPGEASMWHEFQLFAARGYGVVFANPRGSGGYGHAFQKANYQDWGAGPASDVLAVVDEAAALPWVDADRLALTGGSYAGYLTAWIVAHDRPLPGRRGAARRLRPAHVLRRGQRLPPRAHPLRRLPVGARRRLRAHRQLAHHFRPPDHDAAPDPAREPGLADGREPERAALPDAKGAGAARRIRPLPRRRPRPEPRRRPRAAPRPAAPHLRVRRALYALSITPPVYQIRLQCERMEVCRCEGGKAECKL